MLSVACYFQHLIWTSIKKDIKKILGKWYICGFRKAKITSSVQSGKVLRSLTSHSCSQIYPIRQKDYHWWKGTSGYWVDLYPYFKNRGQKSWTKNIEDFITKLVKQHFIINKKTPDWRDSFRSLEIPKTHMTGTHRW